MVTHHCLAVTGIPSTGFDPQGIRRVGADRGRFRRRGCRSVSDRPGQTHFRAAASDTGSSQAPVIAVSDQPSLENTLALFDCGVDDVVRKPVHPREILARAAAIRRRLKAISDPPTLGRSASSRTAAIPKSTAKSFASAPRAPHSRIPDCQPRAPGNENPDLQRHLRHLRRRSQRERR